MVGSPAVQPPCSAGGLEAGSGAGALASQGSFPPGNVCPCVAAVRGRESPWRWGGTLGLPAGSLWVSLLLRPSPSGADVAAHTGLRSTSLCGSGGIGALAVFPVGALACGFDHKD